MFLPTCGGFFFKVKYVFIKAPVVQIVLQEEDLHWYSRSSMKVNEALHAAIYTYVWQDFGLSSLTRDLRRKSSPFSCEEAVLSAVVYIKPEIVFP